MFRRDRGRRCFKCAVAVKPTMRAPFWCQGYICIHSLQSTQLLDELGVDRSSMTPASQKS